MIDVILKYTSSDLTHYWSGQANYFGLFSTFPNTPRIPPQRNSAAGIATVQIKLRRWKYHSDWSIALRNGWPLWSIYLVSLTTALITLTNLPSSTWQLTALAVTLINLPLAICQPSDSCGQFIVSLTIYTSQPDYMRWSLWPIYMVYVHIA
jgi:hypothetical protein